jgi:hypothetical protein
MQTQSLDLYRMPVFPPKPGYCTVYISLSELKTLSVTNTISMLLEMGYNPQIRYYENENGLFWCLLLREGPYKESETEKLIQESRDLSLKFFPDNDLAVSFVFVPHKQPLVAA